VAWERRVTAPAVDCGAGSPAVLARWAREAVADEELDLAAGRSSDEQPIERLGLDFGIATRRTSWVAVSDGVMVDPTQPTRRVEMPQALPVGMSATSFCLGSGPLGFGEDKLGDDELVATFAAAAPRRLGLSGPPPGMVRFHRTFLGGSRGRRWVRGRLVLATPGRLVIEFEVESHPLSWHPATTVTLHPTDEVAALAARVVTIASTASGRIEPGCTVRLVLDLDDPAPAAPYTVEVRTGGGRSDVLLIGIEAP
jgi:hypothetical protein